MERKLNEAGRNICPPNRRKRLAQRPRHCGALQNLEGTAGGDQINHYDAKARNQMKVFGTIILLILLTLFAPAQTNAPAGKAVWWGQNCNYLQRCRSFGK